MMPILKLDLILKLSFGCTLDYSLTPPSSHLSFVTQLESLKKSTNVTDISISCFYPECLASAPSKSKLWIYKKIIIHDFCQKQLPGSALHTVWSATNIFLHMLPHFQISSSMHIACTCELLLKFHSTCKEQNPFYSL